MTDNGSNITFQAANSIKIGDYILIKNTPCKVVELMISKPGKHGSAKCRFIGIDIFTSKKHETICPGDTNVEVPVIVKKDYILADVCPEVNKDGSKIIYACLIRDGEIWTGVKLPDNDLGKKIEQSFETGNEVTVTVLSAMGDDLIIGSK